MFHTLYTLLKLTQNTHLLFLCKVFKTSTVWYLLLYYKMESSYTPAVTSIKTVRKQKFGIKLYMIPLSTLLFFQKLTPCCEKFSRNLHYGNGSV